MQLNRREMIAALSALGLAPSALARDDEPSFTFVTASPAGIRNRRVILWTRVSPATDPDERVRWSVARDPHEAGTQSGRFERIGGGTSRSRSTPPASIPATLLLRFSAGASNRPSGGPGRCPRPRRACVSPSPRVPTIPTVTSTPTPASPSATTGLRAPSRRLPVRIQTRRVLRSSSSRASATLCRRMRSWR